MKTTIDRLAEHFEDLRQKAPNLRDVVYLDGVLSVIDQYKENEESDPQIDWNYVLRFISYKRFDWNLASIKQAYEDYTMGEYVSFTARQIIENAILPQLHEITE